MLKAVKFAAGWREQCIERKESLLFESVLSASDKLDFIKKAKDAGYFIRVFLWEQIILPSMRPELQIESWKAATMCPSPKSLAVIQNPSLIVVKPPR